MFFRLRNGSASFLLVRLFTVIVSRPVRLPQSRMSPLVPSCGIGIPVPYLFQTLWTCTDAFFFRLHLNIITLSFIFTNLYLFLWYFRTDLHRKGYSNFVCWKNEGKMEHILDEVVPSDELKKFEQKYHEEMLSGQVTPPPPHHTWSS